MNNIVDLVESQLIISIKDPASIEKATQSNSNVVFLLTGDLLSAKDLIKPLQEANKHVFIHLDFIDGISNSKSAIKFIAKEWKPCGIITTKASLVKLAKEEGLMTIQRIFLLDRGALNKGIEMVQSCKPDAVEVLPGLMPKIIYDLTERIELPLIVGGLIQDKEDCLQALQAGALAVSVGNPELWDIEL
ncbi:glycerol-3-phosphate responsive antiterminator [Fredinandcohnia humi]